MSEITSIIGDTLKMRVRAYRDTTRKAPYSLVGKTVEFRAVNRVKDPTITITKSSGDGIEHVTPDTGEVEITLDPADTQHRGVLLYTIRVTDGQEVYTISSGKIAFVDPI